MKQTRLPLIFLSVALLGLLGSLTGCRSAGPSEGCTVTDGTLVAYNGSDTEVTLPEEVKRIGSAAFQNSPAASGITRITLGDAVEEIHSAAFSGLPALQAVEPTSRNPFFRALRDDRADCSFLCAVEEPEAFCFPGGDTVALSADDGAPYFYGEDTEMKLACQGAVFHIYRHTDGDDVPRWYCRAIRYGDYILEFREAEDFSGGNYETCVFSTNAGGVVFQRRTGGFADAWFLSSDGWAELPSSEQLGGAVSLYRGEDGSLRYRKILEDYTEWDQLAQLPQAVDGSDLYCEEGAVTLSGEDWSFQPDFRQTVSEYLAARASK